jgi:hypothetical protein
VRLTRQLVERVLPTSRGKHSLSPRFRHSRQRAFSAICDAHRHAPDGHVRRADERAVCGLPGLFSQPPCPRALRLRDEHPGHISCGSMLSLRAVSRCGITVSVCSTVRHGGGMSVLASVFFGRRLSVRVVLRVGSKVSTVDFLALCSSLSVRCTARCGSSLSVFSQVRWAAAVYRFWTSYSTGRPLASVRRLAAEPSSRSAG